MNPTVMTISSAGHTCAFPKVIYVLGGYSLYLDDRDDCHINFWGVVIGGLVFFRGCSSEIY